MNESANELLFKAISTNDINGVRQLLASRRREIDLEHEDFKGGDGDPFLTHALNNNHLEIARILIEAGADVNHGNNGRIRQKFRVKDPLNRAISCAIFRPNQFDEAYHIVELLLQRGADLNQDGSLGRISAFRSLFHFWDKENRIQNENCLRLLQLFSNYGADPTRLTREDQKIFDKKLAELNADPKTVKVILINKENSQNYNEKLLTWLEADFNEKGQLDDHFWGNRGVISKAFSQNTAMIALDKNEEIIGYMIWNDHEARAEIDIIEVREDYRGKGISKKMLASFSEKFNYPMLSATVLPQSEPFFTERSGWKATKDENRNKRFIKLQLPISQPLNGLTDGCVIAVCPEDFYAVSQNKEQYSASMKYFKVSLNEEKELNVPLITEFPTEGMGEYDGYIGIYFNQQLIAEGKAKHLFENSVCYFNYLIIERIKAKGDFAYKGREFFSYREESPESEEENSGSEEEDVTVDSSRKRTEREDEGGPSGSSGLFGEPPLKRQNVQQNPGSPGSSPTA